KLARQQAEVRNIRRQHQGGYGADGIWWQHELVEAPLRRVTKAITDQGNRRRYVAEERFINAQAGEIGDVEHSVIQEGRHGETRHVLPLPAVAGQCQAQTWAPGLGGSGRNRARQTVQRLHIESGSGAEVVAVELALGRQTCGERQAYQIDHKTSK